MPLWRGKDKPPLEVVVANLDDDGKMKVTWDGLLLSGVFCFREITVIMLHWGVSKDTGEIVQGYAVREAEKVYIISEEGRNI